MENNDCVFCKIISGEYSCYKIYENDFVLAFLDIAKDCYGHTLVVPKKHFKNILDCDEKYLAECVKAIKIIGNHYVKDCGFDGINVLNANEESAEQSVFHLHFHIIPRKKDDKISAFPKFFGTEEPLEKQVEFLKIK